MQPVGQEILPGQHPDDVIDAHQQGRDQQDRAIHAAVAPHRAEKPQHYGQNGSPHQNRHRDCQRRPDALPQHLSHADVIFRRRAQIPAHEPKEEMAQLRIEEMPGAFPQARGFRRRARDDQSRSAHPSRHIEANPPHPALPHGGEQMGRDCAAVDDLLRHAHARRRALVINHRQPVTPFRQRIRQRQPVLSLRASAPLRAIAAHPPIFQRPCLRPVAAKKRLVVAVLGVKRSQRLGAGVLPLDHLGGRPAHHVKQHKRQQQDPQRRGNHLQHTFDGVTKHRTGNAKSGSMVGCRRWHVNVMNAEPPLDAGK